MVNKEAQLDHVFSALADPTRRAILQRLGGKEMSVAELAAPFDISKPAISKHLKVLQRAGLLGKRVDGRLHHCRLQPQPLETASEWMRFYRRFWNQKLDQLDQFLQTDAPATHESQV